MFLASVFIPVTKSLLFLKFFKKKKHFFLAIWTFGKRGWDWGNLHMAFGFCHGACLFVLPLYVMMNERRKCKTINMFYLNTCTMHLLLFCTMTNKCTIISQIITLLHVSTLSCHPQGACNQYLPSYTSI